MRCGSSGRLGGLKLLPNKVTHGKEDEPRRAGKQRDVEVGDPPGGNEHGQQRENAESRAPDSERRDASDGAIFFFDAEAKGDVSGERHEPIKGPPKKATPMRNTKAVRWKI